MYNFTLWHRTGILGPVPRVVILALYRGSHVLQVIITLTHSVFFDAAQQVPDWNHMFIFTN